MDIFRGDPVILWDSLATLPVVTDLVDTSDGKALAETQNAIPVKSQHGLVEIWRDDALDLLLTHATGTLTLTGLPTNGQTFTIGGKTYTWQDTLTNVDGNVKIGASAAACVTNAVAAIMLGAGSGTLYAAATTANASVTAVDGAGDTVVVTAIVGGTAGNSIATTETMSNATWGGSTLSGGAAEADADAAVQGPVTLCGWNGSAWFPIAVVSAVDIGVGRQRGVAAVVQYAGLYEYLALVAAENTVSDSGTVKATYTPIRAEAS